MLAIKTNMDMQGDNPAESRQEVGRIAIAERASVVSLSQGELTFIKTESYRLKLRGLLMTGKKALWVKKKPQKQISGNSTHFFLNVQVLTGSKMVSSWTKTVF